MAVGLAACRAGKGDDSAAGEAVCACDETPVADARGDGSATPGVTYTLDGSGSTVCDGGPPTCTWTVESVPSDSTIDTGDLDTSDSCTATFVPDAVGAYVIGLTVTDACGAVSATDLVVLNVTSSSGAPVANCTAAPRHPAFDRPDPQARNTGGTGGPQGMQPVEPERSGPK